MTNALFRILDLSDIQILLVFFVPRSIRVMVTAKISTSVPQECITAKNLKDVTTAWDLLPVPDILHVVGNSSFTILS